MVLQDLYLSFNLMKNTSEYSLCSNSFESVVHVHVHGGVSHVVGSLRTLPFPEKVWKLAILLDIHPSHADMYGTYPCAEYVAQYLPH